MSVAEEHRVRGATLRLFWSTARLHPVLLGVALVLPVLTVVSSSFLGPLFVAELLSRVQAGTVTWETCSYLILWYAVSQIFGHIIGWRLVLAAMWSFVQRGVRDLYRRVFDHLTEQSLAFHSDVFGGALVAKTMKLIGAYHLYWDAMVWKVVPVGTTIVAAVAILAFVVPPYAVFLAGMTATFMAAVLLARPRLHALNIGEAEATARMTGFLADVMTNISTVKAHGTEHLEQAAAYDVSADWMAADRRVKYGFLGYSTVLSSLIVLTNVGALVASVLLTERADIDLAGVYLAVTYTLVVTGSIWEVNQIMRSYAKVLGDAHHMVSILDTPSTVVDEHEVPLQPGDGEIRFERVVFSYTGADEPLFTGLDLTVAPGEAVGLVGPSGSGKTTLTRLLLRYFDVDAGRVVVDGQDVRDVTQASLRRTIAYVPQDPMLFHRSIRENIAYGLPDATEEMVREAAAKAQALGFIEALPRGFDTDIGERGVKLSGGQRQRIAIARAILKDARILVFDEATSALDSASEAVIQRALTEAMAGRTTIIIAHRLSTVARMDRIAVMSNGRIVEEGPPGELLTRGGAFAALWDHESGGFVHSPGG